MDAESQDAPIAGIAAAIAEPARARMLCLLLDGHARTSTQLAAVAGVSASTASVHLAKLADRRLVKVLPQGRHRYYSLHDGHVAAALEALTVVAGGPVARPPVRIALVVTRRRCLRRHARRRGRLEWSGRRCRCGARGAPTLCMRVPRLE